MKDKRKSATLPGALLSRKGLSGFSLIELIIAMALFLVVGGAVVGLIRRHMPLFNTAQNQAALNINLRNAVAQLQMEAVNAGSGFSTIHSMQASPIGATITSHTSTACANKTVGGVTTLGTGVYVAACFDTLTLITADGSLPAFTPSFDHPAGVAPAGVPTTNLDTNVGGTLYLSTVGDPTIGAGLYKGWASQFKDGDEIMLVQGGTEFTNGQPSIAVLSVSGAVDNGNYIQLTYTATTNVANCVGAVAAKGVPAGATGDKMGLYDPTAGTGSAAPPECQRFTNIFIPGLDYAIRLNSTQYKVDLTNSANPTLIRTYTTPPTPPSITPVVVQDKIAEQIVGFSVDAWSSRIGTGGYSTLSNSGAYNRDWASIRSLKIQLMARATPNTDNSIAFKNAYDQGNYQVQGISVVINLRNLNTN